MGVLAKNSELQVVAYKNDGERNSIITVMNFSINWEKSTVHTDDEIEECVADIIEMVADAIIAKGQYKRKDLDITTHWFG